MTLLQVPLPNLIFYITIVCLIIWALVHASEARQFERQLVTATEVLDCGFRTIVITDYGIVITDYGNVIRAVTGS